MKKKILIIFALLLNFLFSPNFSPIKTYAQNTCVMEVNPTNVAPGEAVTITIKDITYNGSPVTSFENNFIINVPQSGRWYTPNNAANPIQNGSITLSLKNDNDGKYIFADNTSNGIEFIKLEGFGRNDTILCSSLHKVLVSGQSCRTSVNITPTSNGQFAISGTVDTSALLPNAAYTVQIWGGNRATAQALFNFSHNGTDDPNNTFSLGGFLDNGYSGGTYNIGVRANNCGEFMAGSCAIKNCTASVFFDPDLPITDPTQNFPQPGEQGNSPGQTGSPGSGTPTNISGTCGDGFIDTAIGCVPIENANSLIGFILRFGVGIGGGIAFLLIVYAGFIIMTSAGNPERLKAGQELLTSAVSGLIMLIFSIFLLRLIGVNILQIPGLGQ